MKKTARSIIFILLVTATIACNDSYQYKTAYASVNGILGKLQEMDSINVALDTLRQRLNYQIGQKDQVFQANVKAYQDKKDWMDKLQQEEALSKLKIEQDSLAWYNQQMNAYYAQKEAEMTSPLLNKVQAKIDSIAEAGGFDYVFNLDAGTPLLLHAPVGNRLDSLVLASFGVGQKSLNTKSVTE